MNRRELFKGLAAAFVVANMPLPVEQLLTIPDSEAIAYLKRVRLDLINKLIYPPRILHEDGTTSGMPELIQSWTECLRHVDAYIKELT